MSLLSSKKAPSDCKAQCPDCGVTLSRLADMNRHRRTKHPDGNETKFPCPWIGCGYEATQRGNLKSHIDARHSDGPKYPCPECGRGFTDAAARIRHRKKLHGYVPYHTKEYLARQALKRKERVVQETSKVDSNKSRRQQVARAVPDLPDASSSVPPPAPELPEVAYHDQSWKMPVDITHSYPPQAPPSQGGPLFLPFETWPGYGAPNAIQHFPSAAQSQPSLTPSNFTVDYYSDLHNVPIPSSFPSEAQSQPSLTPSNFTIDYYSDLLHSAPTPFPSAAQSQPSLTPSDFTLDYYSDLHNVPTPSSFPSEAQSQPSLTPSNFTIDCFSDLLHSAPTSFPSAAQSQPSLTPSDFTLDYYPDLHDATVPTPHIPVTYGPQLRTMQPQQQEFGESFTGDLFNGNGPWNWPLQ